MLEAFEELDLAFANIGNISVCRGTLSDLIINLTDVIVRSGLSMSTMLVAITRQFPSRSKMGHAAVCILLDAELEIRADP